MIDFKVGDYTSDPEAHVGHGMQRQCELSLLAMLAAGMGGLVVIGCGHGCEFKALEKYQGRLQCLGIDRFPDVTIPWAEYWQRELFPDGANFSHEVREELSAWRDKISGSVLWYTDNGFKIGELIAMHQLCRPGDIIGTHDFSTEVPLDSVPFLAEAGFVYMDECDLYINRFYCLQGFWKKV